MMEGLGYRIPLGFMHFSDPVLKGSVLSSIDIVVILYVNSTNDMQEYLADPNKAPDANRKGHLNSDIGGITPKTKMYKFTDVGGTLRKKILKKDSAQG